MFFQRELTNDLRIWAKSKTRKPLLLEGARQVGKTALLKHFGKLEFERHYYFNFERDTEIHRIFEGNLDPKRIIEDLELRAGEPIDPFKSLIIFDEIQSCERALTSIKYFAEDLKGSFIVCAGSLLGVSLGSSPFPVGKVERLTLYPLSFREFVGSQDEPELSKALEELNHASQPRLFALDKLWSLMLQYFVCGGLPEAVLAWHAGQTKLEKIALIKDVQNRIYRDYLADIAKYSGNENAMHIESILTNIPSQLAREADGNASKFQFKNVIKGKKSFEELRGPIDWLRRAGLIHQVFIAEKGLAPLTAYIKENRFKLYLFDLGILRHLANFQPHELMEWGDNMYKGFYAENFVLNELLTRKIALPKAWREGDSEIEFLVECSKGIVPIDVKSGHKRRSKSLSIFKERYHPKESYILAGKQFSAVSGSNKKEVTLTRPLFVIPASLQE